MLGCETDSLSLQRNIARLSLVLSVGHGTPLYVASCHLKLFKRNEETGTPLAHQECHEILLQAL